MNNLTNFSADDFFGCVDVSRETRERLTLYAKLLEKWQRRINLVGPKTIPDLWRRHFLDSVQLYKFINKPGELYDLGSGAGFPGLVLAIMGVENVTLMESNQKKCSFLHEVIRQTGCNASVYNGRIEDFGNKESARYITARALAPLEELIQWGYPLLQEGGTCLFLKGKSYEQELTQTQKKWTMSVQAHPSIVEENQANLGGGSSGVLLEIGNLSPRD